MTNGAQIKAVTVRLPRDQADTLEEMARVDDVPVAELVREAVARLIEARKSDGAFRERVRESLERNRRILELFSDAGEGQ